MIAGVCGLTHLQIGLSSLKQCLENDVLFVMYATNEVDRILYQMKLSRVCARARVCALRGIRR